MNRARPTPPTRDEIRAAPETLTSKLMDVLSEHAPAVARVIRNVRDLPAPAPVQMAKAAWEMTNQPEEAGGMLAAIGGPMKTAAKAASATIANPNLSGFATPQFLAHLAAGGVGAASGAVVDEKHPALGAALGGIGGLVAGGAVIKGAKKLADRQFARLAEGATDLLPAVERAAVGAEAPAFETAAREAEALMPPGRVPPAAGRPGVPPGQPIDPDEYINIGKLALDPTGQQRVRDTVARLVVAGQIPEKRVVSWKETRATANRVAEDLGLDPKDIDVRLGTKGRLSGPEMLAMENVIRTNTENVATLEKRLVDEAAALTGEEARKIQTTIDLANRQTDALLTRLSGSRSAAGRDLNNLKILANTTMDPATWLRRAQERMGGPMTDEVRATVRRFINQGDKAGLARYVANLRKASLGEKAVTLWKAGLLTSPTTHLANIMGNTSMAMLETAKDAPAMLFDRIVSLRTGVRTKDFAPIGSLRATLTGASQGMKTARAVMRGEVSDLANLKLDQLREVNYDNAFLNAYTKGVFRTLDAEDKVFAGAAMQRSLAEQARLLAKKEGLAGEALAQRVAELEQAPTDEMALVAINDANVATFRNKSALGEAARGLKRPLGALGEAVVPFTSTPANVAMRTLEYSPLGFGAAGVDAWRLWKAAAKDIPAAQKQLVERLGRASVGTTPILAGFLLHRAGKMTASTPVDPSERSSWELEGRTPNSVLVGGKWMSVDRISPIGNLMALGAHLSEMAGKPEATTFSVAAGAAGSMGKTLSEQSFLKGVQGALDVINDPERSAARYLQQQAGSVVPTVVARVAGGLSGSAKAPEDPLQQIESRIPVLASRVPARLNAFGEPVKREGGVVGALFDPTNARTDVTQNDPLVAEIARTGAQVPRAAKIKGESPVAYRARQVLEGQRVREVLELVIKTPGYQNAEDISRQLVERDARFQGGDEATIARNLRRYLLERAAGEARRMDNQTVPGSRLVQRLMAP